MNGDKPSPDPGEAGWIPETRWTLIFEIQSEKDLQTPSEALEELCEIYREPIVTAFRVKHGLSPEDSEDAAHEFLVWFLKSELLDNVDRAIGRFRNYLLTCLDKFASNRRRKVQAIKRGGKAVHVPIHPDTKAGTPGIQIAGGEDPEHQIHVAWARAATRAAKNRFKNAEFDANRGNEWEVLKGFLSFKPDLNDEEAAARLGVSMGNLKVKIHRFRKRFYRYLCTEVSATVSTEEEFAEEMAFLRDIFS